jgi:F-type H+-transporting ATPase subunit epsilon
MAESFQIEVATPEKLVLRETATEAQIPCLEGYIGVLPQHAPLISELGEGELSFDTTGGRRRLNVKGGYVEVLPDLVRILADEAVEA